MHKTVMPLCGLILRDIIDIVQVDGRGTIGVMPMGYKALTAIGHDFATVHEEFTLARSIPEGIKSGVETLGGYVSSLKFLFSKSGAEQIGGFGAIGGCAMLLVMRKQRLMARQAAAANAA